MLNTVLLNSFNHKIPVVLLYRRLSLFMSSSCLDLAFSVTTSYLQMPVTIRQKLLLAIKLRVCSASIAIADIDHRSQACIRRQMPDTAVYKLLHGIPERSAAQSEIANVNTKSYPRGAICFQGHNLQAGKLIKLLVVQAACA